jgi:hypothetical protein
MSAVRESDCAAGVSENRRHTEAEPECDRHVSSREPRPNWTAGPDHGDYLTGTTQQDYPRDYPDTAVVAITSQGRGQRGTGRCRALLADVGVLSGANRS